MRPRWGGKLNCGPKALLYPYGLDNVLSNYLQLLYVPDSKLEHKDKWLANLRRL